MNENPIGEPQWRGVKPGFNRGKYKRMGKEKERVLMRQPRTDLGTETDPGVWGRPPTTKSSSEKSLQWRPYGALLGWSGALLALGPLRDFLNTLMGSLLCSVPSVLCITSYNVVFWRLAWYRDNIDASMVTLVGGLWTLPNIALEAENVYLEENDIRK